VDDGSSDIHILDILVAFLDSYAYSIVVLFFNTENLVLGLFINFVVLVDTDDIGWLLR